VEDQNPDAERAIFSIFGMLNLRRFLAPFLVVAAFALPFGASAEGPALEVEKLERDLVAAIGRGDLATYDRIVADDYVAFEASGKTTPKADIMAGYRSGARKYTDLTIFDVEGRVFGETAVVTAKTKGLRREGDRDVPNRVRYIRVYAKRDGRWRAVAQMAAPVPTEEPPKAN
jgi:ketosteroid isomerase-like protein